jgi:hypothetical protein
MLQDIAIVGMIPFGIVLGVLMHFFDKGIQE